MSKFILFLIIIISITVSSVGTLNFIYDEVYFADVMNKKIEITTENRRIVIPLIIKKYNPKCIFIGTSRIGRGMSHKNNYLTQNHCLNLYLNGANIDEINLIIKLVLRNNIEKLIIGLDFFSFNKNYKIKESQNNLNKYDFLVDNIFLRIFFNFERLISLKNLKKILIDKKIYSKDNNENIEKIYHKTFDVTTNKRIDVALIDDRYIKSKALRNYFDKESPGHNIGNFKTNDNALNELVFLIKKLNNKNINTNLFFSPINVYLLEGILTKYKDEYFEIIKTIAKSTDQKNSFLYDFSGYNSVTSGLDPTEEFVNGYYFDLGHYSSEVGELITNKFDEKKYFFGTIINFKQINNYIAIKDSERLEWKINNQRDNNIIKKTLKCKNQNCIENIILKSFELSNNLENKKTIIINKNQNNEILIKEGYFHYGLKNIHRTINDSEYSYEYLDNFLIDKYEVSNNDFILNSNNSELIKKIKNFKSDIPITGVTYFEAENYCKSLGKRLPTEKEWEKSVKQKKYIRYPWGNSFPNCKKINFNGEKSIGCGKKTRNKDITESGNLTDKNASKEEGKSPYGVFNLSGNVWEYVESKGEDAITKGGSWSSEFIRVHSSGRYTISKNAKFATVGFRCARDIY